MSDQASNENGAPPDGASPGRSHGQTDRNLLLGLLALQNNLITREQLVTAFSLWVLDKQRGLVDLLQEQHALQPDTRALLEALVRLHVERHNNDPQQSLQALSTLDDARGELLSIASPELQASLQQIPSPRSGADPFATLVGSSTSQGTRFRILRPHARGGLGEVHVALDTELHREVALKEIQNRHADHHDVRARFKLEAEITGGLEHPGIVPVYGLGTYEDGRPFYAMRFIKGDNLQEAIARFHAPQAKGDAGQNNLQLRGLLRRLIDVCDALQYAHDRGILHRDLKPGNIMIGKYGETLVVDWGLAKVIGSAAQQTGRMEVTPTDALLKPSSHASGEISETLPGSAIGTPAYMSPEQAAGQLDKLGPGSDVYSLGATLYHILTGQPPFLGSDLGMVLKKVKTGDLPSARQLKASVPLSLDAICRRAMALQPEQRYASPRELSDDLEHWLADEPVVALPENWIARTARWLRRNRAIAVSISVATPVILGSLLIANYLVGLARQKTAESLNRETRALALSTYVTAFETGLQREPWDQAHLASLDATLADLEKLSPERSVKGRQRLITRYAELLQKQLRAPRLTEADRQAVNLGLTALETRDQQAAETLRAELQLRLNSWEPVLQLQGDLAGWNQVFDPQAVELRDGKLVPITPADQAIVPADGPTEFTARRIATNQVASADVQSAATFEIADGLTKAFGIEFLASEKAGYSFLVIPAAKAAGAVSQPDSARLRIAILRNGQPLRETVVPRDLLAKAPMRLRAQRQGSRLEFQVNELPPLEMIDPYPLPMSTLGKIAVQFPDLARLTRFTTDRMHRPSTPSPLESADEFYAQGTFQEALIRYRKQAQESGDDEYGKESRYKQAQCLLALAQKDEAQRIWEQLSVQGGSRWSTLADFQLWSLYLEDDKRQEAEDVYQKLSLNHKFEDLARIAPEELRQNILRLEKTKATFEDAGIYLIFDRHRTKVLQRAVDLQRLLNHQSSDAYFAAYALIRQYRAFGDYERATLLSTECLKSFSHFDHLLIHSSLLRETGHAAEALALVDREIASASPWWQSRWYALEIERLYNLFALERHDEAERLAESLFARFRKSYDQAVASGVTPDTEEWLLVVSYSTVQFIRGFLLESRGNHEGAIAAWREASLSKISGKRPLSSASAKVYFVIRSLTNDFDEADWAQLTLYAGGGRAGGVFKLVETYLSHDRLFAAVKDCCRNPRAMKMIRRLAFDQLTTRENMSLWPVAAASHYIADNLRDTEPHPEREELIWETAQQGYDLVSVDGKLTLAQFLPLAVTWKGNPGFLGWDSVAQSLPADFRGKLAYLLGVRYEKLSRTPDALKFYQTAIKSSPADSLAAKLATEAAARLRPQ